MKLLVDMNLSPAWVGFLQAQGFEATHWSSVGDGRAPDSEIMTWAHDSGFIVFTTDLDFSLLVALTRGRGPSVLQLRAQDTMPDAVGTFVIRALREHEAGLAGGAIVTVDEAAARIRSLPILKALK